ncbi:hypothetical protein FPQ18DRAFT_261947 [Pyronema domesticum]|nr:hypothetical protein FPQ18DRAFT_261947 [Pyronema domesticum]
MHHVLRFTNAPPRSVIICHEKSINVTLPINAHEFIAETPEQLQYWYKDANGWQSTPTTAFAMKRGINAEILEKYIQDHTYYFVETSFGGNHIMADIFMAAFKYARTEENFLLRDTLQLWTAIQLLIKGASLHPSSDLLGMMAINNPSSTQANSVPPPRVLANQIEHSLERRIWQLEKQILSELQKRIFGRKKEDWLKIFFTTVVLMNSLERDSWRLYYWMCHSEQGNTWQHPTAPKRLIEKNDALAESLAAHFAAISKGITPFALDWSREQSFGLIGNCEDPHGVLGAIERIGRGLRNPEHAIYTGNVMAHYSQHDERSLDFLYSSKVMIV